MKSIQNAELVITLLIFVKEGKEEIFLKYEAAALPYLEKYNGKLEYRFRPNESSCISEVNPRPYEVHVLSFQTVQDFDYFRRDQDRLLLADMYHESVKTTVMIQGQSL